jgi:tRNA (Thr-GGU) A37 N-methylase
VDLLDGTPVLDVKPYVERFDRPSGEVRSGWFDAIEPADGTRPMDLGPAS